MGFLKKAAGGIVGGVLGGTVGAVGGQLFGGKIKKALLGTPGTAGGFIDPELEQANLRLARGGFGLSEQIQTRQREQLGRLGVRAEELDALALAAQRRQGTFRDTSRQEGRRQAAAEIESRRGALGVAQQGQQRQLGRQIARRGLGGSAAGLFAQQRADRFGAQQRALIESQRGQLARGFEERKFGQLQSDADRLSQQQRQLGALRGGIIGQVERPGITTRVGPTAGRKGLIGALGAAAGGAAGTIIGGGVGGKFGSDIGGTLGGAVGDFSVGPPRRRTNVGTTLAA